MNKSELVKLMAEDHNLSKDEAVLLVNVFLTAFAKLLSKKAELKFVDLVLLK